MCHVPEIRAITPVDKEVLGGHSGVCSWVIPASTPTNSRQLADTQRKLLPQYHYFWLSTSQTLFYLVVHPSSCPFSFRFPLLSGTILTTRKNISTYYCCRPVLGDGLAF